MAGIVFLILTVLTIVSSAWSVLAGQREQICGAIYC